MGPRGYEYVYISAGTLDAPTAIKGAGHIWLSEKGDYYEVDDGLPKSEGSSKALTSARRTTEWRGRASDAADWCGPSRAAELICPDRLRVGAVLPRPAGNRP